MYNNVFVVIGFKQNNSHNNQEKKASDFPPGQNGKQTSDAGFGLGSQICFFQAAKVNEEAIRTEARPRL